MAKTKINIPVSIGDTIFVIPSKVNYELNIINGYEGNNRVYEQQISSIHWWRNDCYLIKTCDEVCVVRSDTQDEVWFLDKCNAEYKLIQLKENASYLNN